MGLLSKTKKATSYLVNFRVSEWLDYAHLSKSANYILSQAKGLFTLKQTEQPETFKQAVLRFELSDVELSTQLKQLQRLTKLFLTLAALLFGYFLFLIILKHNYMGACMTFALMLYSLSLAFRYHFWRFQIQQKRLGCTLKEWRQATFKRNLSP